MHRSALWYAALPAALAALLAPALWNGWPLVFFDTGGYVKRAFDLELEPGRSIFYGLFLAGGSLGWMSLWGPVLLQAGATLWLLQLTLRTADLPAGPAATALLALGLSALTGISWYVGQLMPDILAPLLVLCLWLLGFRRDRLGMGEKVGVGAVAVLALLSHMSSMALAAGLVACTALAPLAARKWRALPAPRPLVPALLVAATVAAMPALTWAIAGQFAFTPGGPAFVFGRLVQDGIAQRFLDEACPDPAYRLCAYRDRMPTTANDWIWHQDSPFKAIGGWGGADAEMSRITRESLERYPLMHLETAAASTLEQLVKLKTGDGLDEWQEVTRWMVSGYLPHLNPGFLDARQQREEVTQGLFDALNAVHVPVAYLSMALSLLALAWALRAGQGDLAAFTAFVWLALLGNALICGALSNPHDRYQGRIVWLAALAAAMAVMRWWALRRGRTA